MPPSLVANVPAVTVKRAGAVDVGVAGEDVAGDRLLRAGDASGAPSVGSLPTSAVLPTAAPAPLNVSSSATGASLTHVTVIETVARGAAG